MEGTSCSEGLFSKWVSLHRTDTNLSASDDLFTATITVYIFCAFEFFIRYLTDTPLRGRGSSSEKITQSSSDSGSTTSTTIEPEAHARSDNIKEGLMNIKLKVITAALIFSTVCLFIR